MNTIFAGSFAFSFFRADPEPTYTQETYHAPEPTYEAPSYNSGSSYDSGGSSDFGGGGSDD